MSSESYSSMAYALAIAQQRSRDRDCTVYVYATGGDIRPYGVTLPEAMAELDDDRIIVAYDCGYLVSQPPEQEMTT